jgi:predicted phosphohydrolase
MRVLAIADPHLSRRDPKPMDVFGPGWDGHPEAFFEGWRATVREDDLVLIPGDLSWAMRLEDALHDLEDIAALPGRTVILRGNHDYWWPSIGKLRRALPPSMQAIQNDALRIGDVVVAGTRGWTCPGSHEFGDQDERIYRRELGRLDLSLERAVELRRPGDALVVMLHYPPTNPRGEPSGFTERIVRAAPDVLVFGHVHGGREVAAAPIDGVDVRFVAADALDFRPLQVLETPGRLPTLANDA